MILRHFPGVVIVERHPDFRFLQKSDMTLEPEIFLGENECVKIIKKVIIKKRISYNVYKTCKKLIGQPIDL